MSWLQVVSGDITVGDTPGHVVFHVSCRCVAPHDCQHTKVTSQSHNVNAKSLHDLLSKGSAVSRQDRSSAVEMEGSLAKAGASIWWVPLPARGHTKAELVKTDGRWIN